MESENSCAHGFDDFLPVDRRAEEMPSAIALSAPGREPLTYGELGKCLQATRNALSHADVRPGDVCALALPNGPELITAFLAISGIGACAPLDPTLTADECRFYLARLGARTLVVRDGADSPAAGAARALGMRVLRIQTVQDGAAGVFTLTAADDATAMRGAAAPSARSTDAALLLYTSATTGAPKLVPLTWGNLRAMAVREVRVLQLSQADRFLSVMPLFHLAGLGSVLTQLLCGGCVISTPGFDATNFPAWLDQFRPTWLKSNPPLNRVLLALAREHPELFRRSSLRLILTSGATPEPELLHSLEEAVGAVVLNGYGLTETGGVTRSTQDARKPGSTGRSSGLDVAILDPLGNRAPAESEGEIVVRGPSVTAGYLDNPEANQATFRDGWFRTGDIGRLDREGFLFITGRLKEMINRGGEKIRPQEVDDVLRTHPALADAAAFALAHPTLGEEVAAAVVLRNGTVVSEPELRKFAAMRLAPFKIPRRVVFVDKIPRTPTGKPKRGVLAEQFRNLTPPHRHPASHPLGAVETALIEIWRRILRVDQIGVDDDFFALGGDSLAVAVMLSDVQKSLRTGLDLLERVDFFDHPTIASLARIVAECGERPEVDWNRPGPAEAPVLGLCRDGSRAPFFCFPASSLDPYYFRHLSKCLGGEQPFFVVCHANPIRDNRLLSVEDLARLSVDAIRRTRPRGPYIIGGHCFGGVVAFEAALQLMSQGEQIECLVLFDAPTPGYPKIRKRWRQYIVEARELVLALARGNKPFTAGIMLQHFRTLGRIVTRRFTGRAIRALTAIGAGVVVTKWAQKTLHGMVMWEYTPRDFPARAIHFIAENQPISTRLLDDPRLGWSEFVRAGLHVRMLKGDHNSMFVAANAPALANQLQMLLQGGEIAPAPESSLLALAAKA